MFKDIGRIKELADIYYKIRKALGLNELDELLLTKQQELESIEESSTIEVSRDTSSGSAINIKDQVQISSGGGTKTLDERDWFQKWRIISVILI